MNFITNKSNCQVSYSRITNFAKTYRLIAPEYSLCYSSHMIEQTGPPLSLTISLLCFCGVLLLVIGVPILGLIIRKDVGKSDTEDKL
ncbi:MAG: hypothetical protein JNM46_01190 [Anaerolineales bacterium]|nr:hypothetical protein [Anaerolineales bacterium]